jgi:hypothetical protein
VYTEVEFHTAIPVQVPPPLELDELLEELDDELLLELEEELLLEEDELELDELLELELDDEELELDELLELELLLEPVASHAPRSFQALVHAQPTPGS